jgi:hypothetical protein
MNIYEKLQELYPGKIFSPQNVQEIPKDIYIVYILSFNDLSIVVGHGKKRRAQVIFDDEFQITKCHIKAFIVRLYKLYGNGEFGKYIIICRDKEEAKIIEKNLHDAIRGNKIDVPSEIRKQLFANLDPNSIVSMILEIALQSSFDGLSDLRKWRGKGLLSDEVWSEISQRLKL